MVFWRPLGTKEFDIGVSKSYDQSVLKHSCSRCFLGARSPPVVRKGPLRLQLGISGLPDATIHRNRPP